MSDLIYMKGMQPVNLDKVATIHRDARRIQFDLGDGGLRWEFGTKEQAKIVYEAILRSKCKNIGDTELTAEELKEIGL